MNDEHITISIEQVDPIKQASLDSPRLAESWLKNGQNQTTSQRIGHTLVSFAFISAAIFLMFFANFNLASNDTIVGLLFVAGALFFLCFGLLGIKNSFRTKHSSKSSLKK